MESLHLPHRSQFLAGCDLQRRRDRRAGRQHRGFGGRQRLRPRRRRRIQGRARQDRRHARSRGIRPRHYDGLHRGRAANIRRPERQTREKIDLDGVGRRDQPARQARRSRSRPLRHRIRRRGQYSADSGFLQALSRPRRRRLLLLRPAEEPHQRLARRRTPEALQRPAGLLHLPAVSLPRWPSSPRSRRPNRPIRRS